MHDDGRVLADVVRFLTCPVCAEPLAQEARELRCPNRHGFDIAKQGYANLLPGNARPGTADTPEMVSARDVFLAAGHFAPMAEALGHLASPSLGEARLGSDGCLLDAGAGTGYYLSAVLDRPEAQKTLGLALDISKYAARRAARAHPRIGAIVADLWRPLPVADSAAVAILNVFAPRNAAEFHRVLRPDGSLVVVTPSSRHLGSLVDVLGLLKVDEQKEERTDATLADHFDLVSRDELEFEAPLAHEEILTLVGMGPSAHHVGADTLAARLSELPDPHPVPLSFVLSHFRRKP
ncbi:putative RNA methyltransferase [Actinomadura rupiterrae]|uniref:putative RNA methyltransferase n=1 Tax=Actinomadura rupiterrae TaxID=559627 RepID=UPI0020A38058|nr:methyltransferase domain-containing protein [Actinomadura rupiterrae]MCP2340933.1 23S rRNA (guanine745-N1)-methyltransferase [Actinomadura rupiterrae]